MSAKSLAQLAEDRDTKQPGQSVVNGSTNVLVATVPTEALTAYTAVIGVVLAANIGASYGPFRWSAYGVFIVLAVLAPLVLVKRRATATTDKDMRKVPVPECLTAGVAAAAWGLVMPGNPLSMIINGNALVFATTAILVGSAAMISLAAQQLGTANSRNATQTEGAAPAAQKEASPAAADEVAPAAQKEAPLAAADALAPAAQEEAPLADQRPQAALDGAPSAGRQADAGSAGYPSKDAALPQKTAPATPSWSHTQARPPPSPAHDIKTAAAAEPGDGPHALLHPTARSNRNRQGTLPRPYRRIRR